MSFGLHLSNKIGPMGTRRFLSFLSNVCLGAVLSSAPLTSQAQDSTYHHGKGNVAIGVFVTDRDSTARLDSDTGTGTDISLESDLGLETAMSVARFNGNVWIKPRQRFDFSIFDLSRSASHRIEESIEYGDEIFDLDALVETTQDLRIVKADYTFSPLNRERGYLGINGGLYTASFELSLSEAAIGKLASESITAPLPVIGLRGEFDITDRITLGGATQWFRIDLNDVSGRLQDFYIGMDYRFGRRMRLGLAFNEVSMNVEAGKAGGFKGRLDWGYDGWLIYLSSDLGRSDD